VNPTGLHTWDYCALPSNISQRLLQPFHTVDSVVSLLLRNLRDSASWIFLCTARQYFSISAMAISYDGYGIGLTFENFVEAHELAQLGLSCALPVMSDNFEESAVWLFCMVDLILS